MAIMHGKAADIYWDSQGTDTNLDHGQLWGLDVSHDVAEITSMQDTWKTYRGGFRDWTATVTCLLDTTGTDISLNPGDPNGLCDTEARLELYLLYSAGSYISLYGDAICNGIEVGSDANSIPIVTYAFQGVAQMQWASGVARP